MVGYAGTALLFIIDTCVNQTCPVHPSKLLRTASVQERTSLNVLSLNALQFLSLPPEEEAFSPAPCSPDRTGSRVGCWTTARGGQVVAGDRGRESCVSISTAPWCSVGHPRSCNNKTAIQSSSWKLWWELKGNSVLEKFEFHR